MSNEKGMFQFTHPGRGATVRDVFLFRLVLVSIHAPREGCDAYFLSVSDAVTRFQFTHPGRGATARDGASRYGVYRFNSRTPGGVRQYGAKLPIMGRINKRNLRLAVLL